MKTGYYHIEVAPLVVLPLSRPHTYSYQSQVPLAPGSWVRVPFGSREADGVVYQSRKVAARAPAWMKSVTEMLQASYLTESQRELAVAVSLEYFTPLGRTLRHFLPKKTVEKKIEAVANASPLGLVPASKPPAPTDEEKIFLEQYRKLKAGEPAAYSPEYFADPKRLLVRLAKKTLQAHKQILILVPEITLFPDLEATFKAIYPPEMIAVLHSKLSPSHYSSAWERVRSNEAQVILATRQGLFAPFAKLGAIVMTEEEDESYKQWDMSPRYDARRVATMLSEQTGARLVFSSVAPCLDTLLAVDEGRMRALSPLHPQNALGETLLLVNLKLERFQKNYTPLSLVLRDRIKWALEQKNQVLLYVERQGLSSFSVCENCKNIFRCPRCHRALSQTTHGYFQCPGCAYKTALFPGCPTCRGLTFRHIGFGTTKIEREVIKLFPKARVVRADSSTMGKRGQIAELYRQGSHNEIDILIGTQMILNNPPLPRLSLTAIIDADSLLSRPDYRADERYFELLSRAASQTNRKKDSVLVQTFHPESALNRRMAQLTPEEISQEMLTERRETGYPPYARAILLVCPGKTLNEAKKVLETATSALENVLPKVGGKLALLTEEPLFRRRNHVYEYALSIRVPDSSILPPSLTKLLRTLTPPCRADVDPLTLFFS